MGADDRLTGDWLCKSCLARVIIADAGAIALGTFFGAIGLPAMIAVALFSAESPASRCLSAGRGTEAPRIGCAAMEDRATLCADEVPQTSLVGNLLISGRRSLSPECFRLEADVLSKMPRAMLAVFHLLEVIQAIIGWITVRVVDVKTCRNGAVGFFPHCPMEIGSVSMSALFLDELVVAVFSPMPDSSSPVDASIAHSFIPLRTPASGTNPSPSIQIGCSDVPIITRPPTVVNCRVDASLRVQARASTRRGPWRV